MERDQKRAALGERGQRKDHTPACCYYTNVSRFPIGRWPLADSGRPGVARGLRLPITSLRAVLLSSICLISCRERATYHQRNHRWLRVCARSIQPVPWKPRASSARTMQRLSSCIHARILHCGICTFAWIGWTLNGERLSVALFLSLSLSLSLSFSFSLCFCVSFLVSRFLCVIGTRRARRRDVVSWWMSADRRENFIIVTSISFSLHLVNFFFFFLFGIYLYVILWFFWVPLPEVMM